VDWADFATAAPEIEAAGRRLLSPDGEAPIGFLATAGRLVHLAPVCPIFAGRGVFLSVAAASPKRRDLDVDGRYALHAFLGPSDEEFRFSGVASLVSSSVERALVHAAIRFGSFDAADPIYELDVSSALWGYWENAGQPGTRPIRRLWSAAAQPHASPDA
jgi:hypothetical protein